MTDESTVTAVVFVEPTAQRIERGIVAEVAVCLGDDRPLAYRLEFDDNLDLHLEPRGALDHRTLTARARLLAITHHEKIRDAVVDAWEREIAKKVREIERDAGLRPSPGKGSVN